TRLIPAGTAAKIESVCITPGIPEDTVHISVQRTVNGQTVRQIEKLAGELWDVSSEAVRLQAAGIYSGTATATIPGLTWLKGEEVYAWGNGRISGPHTVNASGVVVLDYEVTYAVI